MQPALLREEDAEAPPPRVHIQCHAVCRTVKTRSRCGAAKAIKKILHGVSADFPPGQLCALMGPSGAGKTTLLSTLRTGLCSGGAITLNGAPFPAKPPKGMIVTIPQDDVLLPGLTPLEMLCYTARLHGVSAERAEAVLRELHFSDEDMRTRIGSVDERGLSGGQRKRVSIALELLADPSLLLVDEPTSGLDAKMAADVVAILKRIAKGGRTVICTVHQPSFSIYSSFERLLLLSRGSVVFEGPVANASSYFASLGFKSPPNENPAEYFLNVLGGSEAPAADSEEGSAASPSRAASVVFEECWRRHTGGLSAEQTGGLSAPPEHTGSLFHALDSVSEHTGGLSPLPHANSAAAAGAAGGALGVRRATPGMLWQSLVLTQRQLHDATQDPAKLMRLLALKSAVGVLIGVIWFGQGRSTAYSSIFPTTGALFLVVNNSTMDTIFETVIQFPLTKALLLREYKNGNFSISAYFAALVLSNIVLSAVNSLLLTIPVYFMVGLSLEPLRVAIFVATLLLMSFLGSLLGITVGAFSADINAARAAIVPTLVPLLIFSGYLIPYKSIPIWFKWAYYASFFQYCFGLLQVNELAGRPYDSECPVQLAGEELYDSLRSRLLADPDVPANITRWFEAHASVQIPANCSGDDFLRQAGLSPTPYGGLGGYFGIICLYVLGFLLAAFAVLRWRVVELSRA